MTSVVGVTMFFNLKPLADQSEKTRSNEFYEKNCVATLSVKIPLVILCDSATREWIEPLRARLSPASTHFVEKNITEYDHYKMNFPIVARNRQNPYYMNPDNRNTTSYFLTTTFKFHAMQIASEILPDATHYAWIDFGCQHIAWEAAERLQSIFDAPKPKVAMVYIQYRSSAEIADVVKTLGNGGPCGLAGTVFTVEKSYMNRFYTRALAIIYEQISKGVGHAEEQIYMYMFDRFPEMFTILYGDYYSVISNYQYPVRDYNTIRHCFIQSAINAGRRDLAKGAAETLMESYIKGLIHIESHDLEFLRSFL